MMRQVWKLWERIKILSARMKIPWDLKTEQDLRAKYNYLTHKLLIPFDKKKKDISGRIIKNRIVIRINRI